MQNGRSGHSGGPPRTNSDATGWPPPPPPASPLPPPPSSSSPPTPDPQAPTNNASARRAAPWAVVRNFRMGFLHSIVGASRPTFWSRQRYPGLVITTTVASRGFRSYADRKDWDLWSQNDKECHLVSPGSETQAAPRPAAPV